MTTTTKALIYSAFENYAFIGECRWKLGLRNQK